MRGGSNFKNGYWTFLDNRQRELNTIIDRQGVVTRLTEEQEQQRGEKLEREAVMRIYAQAVYNSNERTEHAPVHFKGMRATSG